MIPRILISPEAQQLIAQLKNLQNNKIGSSQIEQFKREAQNADANRCVSKRVNFVWATAMCALE